MIDKKITLNISLKSLKDAKKLLYLGRGFNFPVALEGALKLKEISYIHVEGYPAAEMKHGPIALIDEKYACCIYCNKDATYDKSHFQYYESKNKKEKILTIATEYRRLTLQIIRIMY